MNVRKGDLKNAGNRLKDALNELARLADDAEDAIPGGDDRTVDSSDPALAAKIQQLQQKMAEADRAWQSLLGLAGVGGADVPVTDDERSSFPAFLSQIGKAMLSTQRKLDDASAAYLRENSGKPHVLPSIFRLPKLSAEMKFALETQRSGEVNLVFFKRQDLARELHQQSIQFDLVSAPPPPGAVASLPGAFPSVDLVLDAAQRKQVLDTAASPQTTAANRLPDGFEPERVVILDARPEQGYIVLYAAAKGANKVGLWLLAGGDFRCIYKFDEKNSASEKFLRQFVSDLADAQGRFLAGA